MLSQVIEGKERVVSYASRALRKAEHNYSTVEKEALAIVWAVTAFRPYLYGHKFTVATDHCPLSWLKSVKEPTGRLARWILMLGEYNMDIVYRRGKDNTNADSLSRRRHHDTDKEDQEMLSTHRNKTSESCAAVGFLPQWSAADLQHMQKSDTEIKEVLEQMPAGRPQFAGKWKSNSKLKQFGRVWHQLKVTDDGLLYRIRDRRMATGRQTQELVVVPTSLVSEILTQLHDQSGHLVVDLPIRRPAREHNRPRWLQDYVVSDTK